MSEHYFSRRPTAEHRPDRFSAELRGRLYHFETDAGVFSKSEIDRGTQLLIDNLDLTPGQTVLDLGCGYGPVGIAAAHLVGNQGRVYLVDVNERAVELARINIEANGVLNAEALVSDGLQALPKKTFDRVVSNPPIRAGKRVVYALLAEGYAALRPEGCLLVVIRTKQGAQSLKAYLEDLAGNCETVERKSGFRILKCCKLPPI